MLKINSIFWSRFFYYQESIWLDKIFRGFNFAFCFLFFLSTLWLFLVPGTQNRFQNSTLTAFQTQLQLLQGCSNSQCFSKSAVFNQPNVINNKQILRTFSSNKYSTVVSIDFCNLKFLILSVLFCLLQYFSWASLSEKSPINTPLSKTKKIQFHNFTGMPDFVKSSMAKRSFKHNFHHEISDINWMMKWDKM